MYYTALVISLIYFRNSFIHSFKNKQTPITAFMKKGATVSRVPPSSNELQPPAISEMEAVSGSVEQHLIEQSGHEVEFKIPFGKQPLVPN